jgi:hypothetical protein
MEQRLRKIPRPRSLATWAVALIIGSVVMGNAVASARPPCSHPVRVAGHFDARAPNLHVLLKSDFEPNATANMLAQKYHFTLSAIWTHGPHGFAIKDIDRSLMSLLQCEPSIESMSFDAITTST